MILFGYSPSRPKDNISKHQTRGRCQAYDAERRRETTEPGQGCSCGNDSGDGCSRKAYQNGTQEIAQTPWSMQPRQPTSIAPEKKHPGEEEEQPTRREQENPDTSWRIRLLRGGLHWWHITEPVIGATSENIGIGQRPPISACSSFVTGAAIPLAFADQPVEHSANLLEACQSTQPATSPTVGYDAVSRTRRTRCGSGLPSLWSLSAQPGRPMSHPLGHPLWRATQALPRRPAPRLRSPGRVLRQRPPGPNPGRQAGGPGRDGSRARGRLGVGAAVPDAAPPAQRREHCARPGREPAVNLSVTAPPVARGNQPPLTRGSCHRSGSRGGLSPVPGVRPIGATTGSPQSPRTSAPVARSGLRAAGGDLPGCRPDLRLR